jgi:predicted O-methyltransferase YrrM
MNADEIAAWSFENTYGSIWAPGDTRIMYTLPELKRLAQAALDSTPPGGTMVEIGVFAGRTLSVLLQVARERGAVVWATDPWRWQTENIRPEFHKMYAHFKNDVDLHFCRMTSEDMRTLFPDNLDIDFIHIDGDHDRIHSDCELWLSSLRSGGLVVLHDMVPSARCPHYSSYVKAEEYLKGWETVWWVAETEECGQMCRRRP